MRALIQRVSSASVEVEGRVVGSIGEGLLVLLGVGRGDDEKKAAWLAEKVANLRVFSDEAGNMNRSLLEVGGGALVVSQFTLYGDARKGRRPGFSEAAPPEEANALYERFCALLAEAGVARVERGVFRAMMRVSLVNEGPVTLMVEAP